jgi:hypothetical protein
VKPVLHRHIIQANLLETEVSLLLGAQAIIEKGNIDFFSGSSNKKPVSIAHRSLYLF